MLIFRSVASLHLDACFPATPGLGIVSENVNYSEMNGTAWVLVCSPSHQQLKERICFQNTVPERQ